MPQQLTDNRQQLVDAAVARVVENIATSLRAMVPEHAIRRLIELEVRAAVQALPLQEPPAPRPDPPPSSALASDRIAYRINEAAAAIGVCRATVYKLIAAGELRAGKRGSTTLIRRVDLEAFIDAMPASRGGPKDD
ncbi:helix-turn-helix domain-containing protein [Methylobacterium terricola]|nr:helix-turn-helix domain-containing protein [Methylobacterium terricola]